MVIMDIWIAKDSDGRMFIHFSEPSIVNTSGNHWQSFPYTSMINIDGTPLGEKFKDLEPMQKPLKIKIKY